MAQSNNSSRYQDIISISTLISKPQTSPAVYKLRPKEEKTGNLTRKILGEKNLMKTNRTILLVGETGTGKSTLINSLVNYTMGVKFDDNIWFEIVEEEKRSQTESQTPDVMVYQIFGYEDKTLPYSLTIIDTPGFGDTRGIEHDDIISQRLLDLFRSDDGVHELSAVGLVLKASENRVSDRLRYIFDSVTSLFGKGIKDNIVTLITHSTGTTPKNALKALEAANIKCAKNKKNQPAHFLFDNQQNTERTEMEKKELRALKNAWETAEEGMEELTDFLKESEPQKLNETVEVLNTRIRLTACINNLKERIQLTELKHREIHQTEEALKKHEEEMKKKREEMEKQRKEMEKNEEKMKKYEEEMKKNKEEMKKHEEEMKKNKEEMKKNKEEMKKHKEEMKKNEEFTVVVDEVYKEKEDIDGGRWGLGFFYEGALTCNICKENCHYPECTMAWKPERCVVMKGGRCTSCTGKCPVSDHVKEEWRYVAKTRKVKKTLENVKQKYEENKSEREKKKIEMKYLQTKENKLPAEKMKLQDMEQKYEEKKSQCERELTTKKELLADMETHDEKNTRESEKKKSLMEHLQTDMIKLTAEKMKFLDEVYQHVVKLEQIALNDNSLFIHVHLDFLIEKMKETGDTEKVEKLEEMKRRVPEKTVTDTLWHMFNKLTGGKTKKSK